MQKEKKEGKIPESTLGQSQHVPTSVGEWVRMPSSIYLHTASLPNNFVSLNPVLQLFVQLSAFLQYLLSSLQKNSAMFDWLVWLCTIS